MFLITSARHSEHCDSVIGRPWGGAQRVFISGSSPSMYGYQPTRVSTLNFFNSVTHRNIKSLKIEAVMALLALFTDIIAVVHCKV